MIRLGFVGAGFMGQLAHLSNYAVLKDCEIVALAEPRPKLAQKVASHYGIKNVFANHRELLANCEVDGVVAILPFTQHIGVVPDILKAKIPLFTEKPLALSVETGEQFVRLAEENRVLHMVGYHKRSDPAIEYAGRLLTEWRNSGEFGQMRLVRITIPPGDWLSGGGYGMGGHITTDEPAPKVPEEPVPDYFDETTGSIYFSFVNYYIHQVNLLRFLLGEPYHVTFVDKTDVLLVAESASGVCGTIELAPYQTSFDWQETILVGFEKGYIRVELPAPMARQLPGRLFVFQNRERESSLTEIILPRISAMENQARNFLRAVKGEGPAPCNSQEALEDLKIACEYMKMRASRK